MNLSNAPSNSARRRTLTATAVLRVSVIAAVIAMSGCSTVKGWFASGSKEDKAASAPTELNDFTPSATVSKLWSAKAGSADPDLGVAQAPAVADGRVYAAAGEGGVRALDLQTGAQAWQYKSELVLTGGPGVGDGLVVVGGLEGDVVALDAATG